MADSPQEALGRAVRKLREERGLSERALAERAGITWTYLHGIEHGRRNPSWGVVVAIARALDLKTAQLVDQADASKE